MRTRLLATIAATSVLGFTACTDVGSADLLTSGMWADLSATATGDGSTRAAAVLRAGGQSSGTFVYLEGDDRLTASVGEESIDMEPLSIGAVHTYRGSFAHDEPGTEVVISLERTVDDGAPTSTMTLPDPFTLSLDGVTPVSRAEDVVITWDPSGTDDEMRVSVDGSCVLPHEEDVSGDPGVYTLPGGTLQETDEAAQANCELTIELTRWRAGEVDPGYGEGGRAVGQQVREITVQSTP